MPPPGSRIDRSRLLGFLEMIDQEMPGQVTLVAVGGTAMTLLGVKPSTLDIDFTGPKKDIAIFNRVHKAVPHGMKIDTWADGWVFNQRLPADYLTKSKKIRPAKRFENIDLRALQPLDVVVTKIGRLDERDVQDIQDCVRRFKLSKADVKRRASRIEYLGNVEDFKYHLRIALQRFFE